MMLQGKPLTGSCLSSGTTPGSQVACPRLAAAGSGMWGRHELCPRICRRPLGECSRTTKNGTDPCRMKLHIELCKAGYFIYK